MGDLVAFVRARLDEDERTARAVMWDGSGKRLSCDAMNPILRGLALPYADHPDYLEAWRP
ncbi:DUF6221 family protein [Streptomyces niveus]|uniref:DUF6221 family protein n=1 Tax=Streptomyces niveus TaxID=193462 RepID=UPI00084BCAFC|nr:DUF6221 family protein [Streptomyces niveus]